MNVEFNGEVIEFPDEATPDQIKVALMERLGSKQMLSPHQLAAAESGANKALSRAKMKAASSAASNLPSGIGLPLPNAGLLHAALPGILGAAGGMVGGVPGAGLGGMAGKAMQYGTAPLVGEEPPQAGVLQFDVRNPMNGGNAHFSSNASGNILGEGLLQGGLQGVGDLLASGVSRLSDLALPLMRNALKSRVGVYKQFPGIDPAEVALEHGIRPHVGVGAEGTAQAEALREAAAARTTQAVQDAWQGGYSGATPTEIARGPMMRGIERNLRGGTAPITDPAQVDDLIQNEFLAKHPPLRFAGQNTPSVPNGRIVQHNVITPPAMNRIRQAAGAAAFPTKEGGEGAMARGATASNWKLYNEGLWKNLTREMEKNVPGFTQLNEETQRAMALERAMREIERPSESALPHGFWSTVYKALRGSNVTGKAALALKSPAGQARITAGSQVAQQVPRGLEEILRYLAVPVTQPVDTLDTTKGAAR